MTAIQNILSGADYCRSWWRRTCTAISDAPKASEPKGRTNRESWWKVLL